MKKVIIYGNFDLLDYEHISLLKQAKSFGDYLVVALSTAECGIPFEERKYILEAVRYVDLIIPIEHLEQLSGIVHEYHVDTFVVAKECAGKFDFLKEEGIEVVCFTQNLEKDILKTEGSLVRDDKTLIKAYKVPETLTIEASERKKLSSDYESLIKEYEIIPPRKSINDYYYNEKIDENSILIVGLAANVRGNMQYILKELNTNTRYANYKIYVRTKPNTDEIVKQYIKQNGWNRTHTVVKNYSKWMEKCKYMITESYFPYTWVKKEQQVLIELWHGTPLKRLGLEKHGRKCHLSAEGQKIFLNSDYFLCPNEYIKDKLLKAIKVDSLLKGQALMLGYPRTGGMLAVDPKRTEKIRKQLAPNGEKIYAYMPTFRGYLPNEEDAEQRKKLIDYLDDHLSDDQILYVNLHHKVDDCIDYSIYKHIKKFPPLIDSYELMTATDALISDYSSVFLDYLVLGKQIILYVDDYDEYEEHHGLYFDLRELPFDIAKSEQDVLDALNRGKQYDDKKAQEYFCSYDTPNSAKMICQLIQSDKNGLNLQDIEKNDKKKILVYTYGAHAGNSTTLLHEFTKIYNKNTYDLFIGVESAEVEKPNNKDSAYPMIAETPVIASNYDPKLSSMGQVVKQLYLDKKISFEKAIEFLKYDYVLMTKRMYGEAEFDMVMIYDVSEPEVVIGLSLMDVSCKFLFLQKEQLEKISAGDRFLHDAIKYASKYCNGVFVSTEEYIEMAKTIVEPYWIDKIQIVNTPSKLLEVLDVEE